jgi:transcriptional regulator with XRE-family HTH domain
MTAPTTRGAIVKNWRNRLGLSRAEVARRAGTSRQNIENVETDKVENPKFLPALAKVMGYQSTDELLQLKEPPSGDSGVDFLTPEAPPSSDERSTEMTRYAFPDAIGASKIIDAVSRLGDLLARASPNTRDAVLAMLTEYSENPSHQQRIGQAIALLLEDEPEEGSAPPATGAYVRGTRIEEGVAPVAPRPRKAAS